MTGEKIMKNKLFLMIMVVMVCGHTFHVKGYINEYPVGAYNFEEINVTEE